MASNNNEPFYMRDHDPDVPAYPEGALPPYEGPSPGYTTPPEVTDGKKKSSSRINYAEYKMAGKGLASAAHVTKDGRITISLELQKRLPDLPKDYARTVEEFAVDASDFNNTPRLSIVIMIVGSRGDVQPYISLGKHLVNYGHRVRVATHETFRTFVTDEGLEFFNIGGNPHDLMSYMVKNPGLIPGLESLTNGDITRKKKMVREMLNGCWRACIDKDEATGRPFIADAIISNPPSFAHIHCAQALGIPLHMSFTMPWTATTAFPHPLVNINHSNAGNDLTNYLSYALADLLTWQGLGDVINKFRTKILGLEPLALRSGPGVLDRVKVPWTYCMSPSLVPKPNDWKNHIDIVGFYFLEQGGTYRPPDELTAFLAAGPPPIYIGFGSVPVEDPTKMTALIFDAVGKAGVRALISVGWGGLGGVDVPSNIYILDKPVPHDWLFDKVFAVCHHGGAGTTAIGLRMGRPTIVVPFFGDQPWWGHQVAARGAGPEPIPHKELTVEKLVDAIKFTQSPTSLAAAGQMGKAIRSEDGVAQGVDSFHRHLPLLNMRCDIDPSRIAVWWSTKYCLKLSAFAAQVLSEKGLIDMNKLDLHRVKEYDTHRRVTDPISGGAIAIFWIVTNFSTGIAKIFYSPVKGLIKTTTAIPRGIMNLISSMHEGFHNAPSLYGSEVREPGKVTDFGTGLKEAGKGFFWAYYDGITGLVVEPMRGAKEEGWAGGMKGVMRSYLNLAMRPAAGAVGLISHPADGAWKSIQKAWSKEKMLAIRRVRILDGLQQVHAATPEAIEEIAAKFKTEESKTKERKKTYVEQATRAIEADIKAQASSASPGSSQSNVASTSTPAAAPSIDIPLTHSPVPLERPPLPPRPSQPIQVPVVDSDSDSDEQQQMYDEEEYERALVEATRRSLAHDSRVCRSEANDFERDLELAKRLSLVEQKTDSSSATVGALTDLGGPSQA